MVTIEQQSARSYTLVSCAFFASKEADVLTKEIVVIDIDERDEVSRLIDEMEPARGPVILRRGGRDVAVITPLAAERSSAPVLPRKVITDEERAAARAAAGSWVGNVDFDAFRQALAESRALPPRPPVDLGDFGKPE